MAAKKNLLAICSEIASDMNSFGFNSIEDDIEGIQIATIVRSTYENMLDTRKWSHTKKRFFLDATTVTTPTTLKLPENVNEVLSVRYDIADAGADSDYAEITYLDPEAFLERSLALNESATNVTRITDVDGQIIFIQNDRAPLHYTSFDDVHLTFDNFDNTVDLTNLVAAKTQIMGYIIPAFSLTDTFIPDLPAQAFSQLIAESKAACHDILLQQVNQTQERKAKRTRQYLAREMWRTNGDLKRFNGGRTGRTRGCGRKIRRR